MKHYGKLYGDTKTHLRLTGKALEAYDLSDGLFIYEHEREDENGEKFYNYTLSISHPWARDRIQLSESELIEWLNGLYDDCINENCEEE